MPRKRHIETREVLADPIFNSTLVEKFICSMMWDGKKAVAQKIFYDSMDKIRERSGDDPLKLFKKAVENTKPLLEVKDAPRGRRQLPGSDRSGAEPPYQPGDPLDRVECPVAPRKGHAGEVGQ